MLVHLIYYYICITWRAYRGIATNLPLLGHFIGIYEGMSLYLLLYVLVHLLLQCTSYYHISGFIGCLICLTGRLIAHLIGKDGFYDRTSVTGLICLAYPTDLLHNVEMKDLRRTALVLHANPDNNYYLTNNGLS
jgi:hypothetical protein